MGFLVNEEFISHAGLRLPFKIECDKLDSEDIKAAAAIIARAHKIRSVHGIPRGGLPLAAALEKYVQNEGVDLIVDDVFTTGRSMEREKKKVGPDAVGAVIFARAPCPDWIKPIFQLSEWARP